MRFRFWFLVICGALSLYPAFVSAQVRDIVFPVNGESSFRDDYFDDRAGGSRQHFATDIIADKHTPVVAAVDGVITYIPRPEPSWGFMITLQDNEGYQYRYIHLNNDTSGTDDGNGGDGYAYAEGLRRGSEVRAGQLLGWVGDSGNAENTVSHLHFEIRDPNRNRINPYPSLIAAAPPGEIEIASAEVTEMIHESTGEINIEADEGFYFTIELREGMEGQAIKELQSRLKEEGYFTYYTTTKYFGPITKTALQSYQRANGIAPTGVMSFETRALLNNETSDSGGLRLEEDLFEGAEGENVLQVQLKLETLGYDSGETDGVYDSSVREAVRLFQRDSGLNPTGYVDFTTWDTLNESYKAAPSPTVETENQIETTTNSEHTFTESLSIGSKGGDVPVLQCLLQDLGFFSEYVECTGYFGPITTEAVAEFQASKGIEAIGIVGPKTRAALNSL